MISYQNHELLSNKNIVTAHRLITTQRDYAVALTFPANSGAQPFHINDMEQIDVIIGPAAF